LAHQFSVHGGKKAGRRSSLGDTAKGGGEEYFKKNPDKEDTAGGFNAKRGPNTSLGERGNEIGRHLRERAIRRGAQCVGVGGKEGARGKGGEFNYIL